MKIRGKDLSSELIWAAALVGMIRYAAAFLASDIGQIVGLTSQVITVLLGVSGFFMGLLGTFGTAYLFDGWRRKMPASGQTWSFKFWVLTIFVLAAFVCELAILVPFTVSRVEHESMSAVLGELWIWWWSVAVNIMPMLLIGGVSVGNQIVAVDVTAQVAGNLPKEPRKDSGNLPTDWRRVRKNLTPEQLVRIATGRTEDICFEFGVTDRTARNYRKKAQEELAKVKVG